jgi:acetyltransferase
MSNQINHQVPQLMSNIMPDPSIVVRASAAPALRLAPRPLAGVPPAALDGPVAGAAAAAAAVAAAAPRALDSACGPLLLRALAPADVAAHGAFLRALGADGRRMRAFALPGLPASGAVDALLLHLVLAAAPDRTGGAALLGDLAICIDRTRIAAEFALAVRPALRGRGLGRILIGALLDACRLCRVTLVCGSAPAGGAPMLALARSCGFQILRAADGSAQLALMLRPRGVR